MQEQAMVPSPKKGALGIVLGIFGASLLFAIGGLVYINQHIPVTSSLTSPTTAADSDATPVLDIQPPKIDSAPLSDLSQGNVTTAKVSTTTHSGDVKN